MDMERGFTCAKGCGRPVKGIYCPEHRASFEAEQRAAREARSASMADPERQAKLQAARREAAACVICGNTTRIYHADEAVDHPYTPKRSVIED